MPTYDAVLVNGSVGVGKTTTAEALSSLEWEAGRRHAVVDLDTIRSLRPPPEGDPWQHQVELANLRSMVENYRAAGVGRFIVSGVVESATELPRYRKALGTDQLLVVLLRLDPDTAGRRLARRHEGDPAALAWHLDRHGELATVLDQAGADDVFVDVGTRTPDDVAREIQRLAGWA